MPGGREDAICQKALKLLDELCSVGLVESDRCLEFNYYLRDSARPRLSDSGKPRAWPDGRASQAGGGGIGELRGGGRGAAAVGVLLEPAVPAVLGEVSQPCPPPPQARVAGAGFGAPV